jgi:hypothetical protein
MLTPQTMQMLYYLRSRDSVQAPMAFPDLARFLNTHVASNPLFSAYLDDDMKAQIEALQSMLDVPEPAPVPKPVKPVTPVEIEEDTFVIVRETIAPLEDQLSPITDIDSLTIP